MNAAATLLGYSVFSLPETFSLQVLLDQGLCVDQNVNQRYCIFYVLGQSMGPN